MQPSPVSNSASTNPPSQTVLNGQADTNQQSIGNKSPAAIKTELISTPKSARSGRTLVVGSIPDKEVALKVISQDMESDRANMFSQSFLDNLGQKLDVKLEAKADHVKAERE
jgi:hypothetical protein